jgi:hypothetical protein
LPLNLSTKFLSHGLRKVQGREPRNRKPPKLKISHDIESEKILIKETGIDGTIANKVSA